MIFRAFVIFQLLIIGVGIWFPHLDTVREWQFEKQMFTAIKGIAYEHRTLGKILVEEGVLTAEQLKATRR